MRLMAGFGFIVLFILVSGLRADPPVRAAGHAAARSPHTRNAPATQSDPDAQDKAILDSIEKAQTFLIGCFSDSHLDDKKAKTNLYDRHLSGDEFYAVYALLRSGMENDRPELRPSNAFMKGLLDHLAIAPIDEHYETYEHSLRLMALTLANRKEDKAIVAADAQWLLSACAKDASYVSSAVKGNPFSSDSFDSHIAQRALWLASQNGVAVPILYWQAVWKLWHDNEQADGWPHYVYPKPADEVVRGGNAGRVRSFNPPKPADTGNPSANGPISPDSTVGGACALLMCAAVAGTADESAIDKSLDSVGRLLPSIYGSSYGSFELTELQQLSGRRFIGAHDWFDELSTRQLNTVGGGAGFSRFASGEIPTTALRLLALAAGHSPSILTQLHLDGSRLHDCPNLLFFAATKGKALNWELLGPDQADYWDDSPVLYISASEALKLTPADFDKIKSFIKNDGTLFVIAQNNSASFDAYIQKTFVPAVFPEAPAMVKLPENDPIFAGVTAKPPLKAVKDKDRILMVYSSADLAASWRPAAPGRQDALQTALNICLQAKAVQDAESHN